MRALDTAKTGELLPGEELSRNRLGEAVLARLSRAILDGRLKPGDPLPAESQIAATFGVSKQIAREAMRELVTMGVVHIQQGKVSRVRAIDGEPLARFFRFAVGSSETSLIEAVELRRMLEPPIARMAAERRSEEDLIVLDKLVARMREAAGDNARWVEADLGFHQHIAQMTKNRMIVLQMAGLAPVIRDVMQRFNQRNTKNPRDWDGPLQRHVRVAEALHAGDPDEAMRAMTAHFALAEVAIHEIYQHNEKQKGPQPDQKRARPRTRRKS
jgi:GntR family transcriptional regulator, transcriptional repressor for pyruvate dehydrogenase complex